jgi:hypothetical protein
MTAPRLLALAALSAALAYGPAMAQSQNSTASTPKPANESKQSLPQELKQKLEKQGFTEVNVVPQSFIVSAKDKEGDPVTIVISPHSLTMFTVSNPSASTTGSGRSGN